MERKIRRIHFVGIGGIGMSGIAEVLLNLGYGSAARTSDARTSPSGWIDLGAAIYKGHHASHIGDADVVVTSTAVKPDNPEVIEAHRRNIPVIPRAEMLAELLKMKFSIAVSGSHGKRRQPPWLRRSWPTAGWTRPWSSAESSPASGAMPGWETGRSSSPRPTKATVPF